MTVSPAFYHWQTNLHLTDNERAVMDSLGAKKLYVKFFDVDWDATRQAPAPLAEVQIDSTNTYGLEIVPTVFITNRTFVNLKGKEVEAFAERVLKKMKSLSGQIKVTEIQMDCDWTESTRKKYFRFLESLHSKLSTQNSKLSATIRLHQLKYPDRTGIPPVGRGMLMAYNMGEVDEWETENSILDLDILQSYLTTKNYPLPLDIALPIFRWGVVFRENVADENNLELAYLINDLGAEDLADTTRFAQFANNRYRVLKNTYLEGYYLYENDRVRLESVSPELLESGAESLDVFIKFAPSKPDGFTLSFYHLDTSTLKVFDHEKLEKVLEKF